MALRAVAEGSFNSKSATLWAVLREGLGLEDRREGRPHCRAMQLGAASASPHRQPCHSVAETAESVLVEAYLCEGVERVLAKSDTVWAKTHAQFRCRRSTQMYAECHFIYKSAQTNRKRGVTSAPVASACSRMSPS